MNLANNGTAIGRATKNPIIFTNSDGSRKVKLTVAAVDNFVSGPEKKKQTRFVPLEAFLPATKQGNGVYDLIHEGDLIAVAYSVRNNNYTDKAGTQQFDIVLNIEDVQLLESKAVTDARQANKIAQAAANDAGETADATETPVE